ncbi:MAG TPA: SDR family oxidoreductase [Chthoniobacterales bacterium]|nr:SDR family oxidoreductase [Chthoniobacterales bacterium]
MTPFSVSLARPLIEGLRNEVIVRGNAARELFPEVQLLDCKTAVEVALADGEAKQLANSLGRLAIPSSQQPSVSMRTEEGMILERRRRWVNASAEKVYSIITQMGGERGWLALNWAWQLREWIDGILGGVGMRRGRGAGLRIGEALDFWRIEAVEAGRSIRLRAEMKLPGNGWLQFQVEPQSAMRSELIQTALFEPKGLAGVLYWFFLYPVHRLIFSGMIQGIAEAAEAPVVVLERQKG